MKINKQLFEDVLAGKLKGTFVLRNGWKIPSKKLQRTPHAGLYYKTHLYHLDDTSEYLTYTENGEYCLYGYECELDIIDFIPDTNMKQNELKIEIPEGKEIDWDESKKQNKIVLKDKQLTYEDICKKVFENKDIFYIGTDGSIYNESYHDIKEAICQENNAATAHQLECILARNKLANVAKYLNDGWKPNKGNHVFYLTRYVTCCEDPENKKHIHVGEYYFGSGENLVLFKTEKVAQQALEILGEETVKLALEPLGI